MQLTGTDDQVDESFIVVDPTIVKHEYKVLCGERIHLRKLFKYQSCESLGGSYTEPRILMDSIWSPGKLLELCQESTWSPSGVHQESPWSPSASSHCALPKNPAGLQVYSCWTPDGVHQDGDFSRTPDPIP